MIGSLSQQFFEAFFVAQAEGLAPEAGEETPPGQFLAALLAAAPEAAVREELAPHSEDQARSVNGRVPGDAEELRGHFSAVADGSARAERLALRQGSLGAHGAASNGPSGIEPTYGARIRSGGDPAENAAEPTAPRLPVQPSPESSRPAPAPAGPTPFEGAPVRDPDASSDGRQRAELPTPEARGNAVATHDARRPAAAGEGSSERPETAALPTSRELVTSAEPRRAQPDDAPSAPREETTRARPELDSFRQDGSGAGRAVGVAGRTDPEVPPSGTSALSGAGVVATGSAPVASDALPETLPTEGRSRVIQDIEWLASRGGGNARVRLHPPELGEIELAVRVRNNEVEVTIRTQDERAFRGVSESREMLIEGLATRDLRTAQLNVTRWSGDDHGGRDADPRQPGQPQDERAESERRGSDGSRQHGAPPNPQASARVALPRVDESPLTARDATHQAIDVRI